MPIQERASRLLYMAASLEESIIRLETQAGGETRDTIQRLRVLQGEILTALLQLEGDFRPFP
jgi:hypothetical protein